MADSGAAPVAGGVERGRDQLNKIFALLSELKGRTSPADHVEEDNFRVREGYHEFKLEPVENEAPAVDYTTAEPVEGKRLVYFARTMQRTQLIGHFVHKGIEVPLHFAITGAIILRREQRNFSIWDTPELRSNLILPFSCVEDKELLARYAADKQLNLVDSGAQRAEYTQLRIAAVTKARELTIEEREKLYDRWRHKEGSDASQILVMSGHVADIPNETLTQNFVGIAQRVYVPWQNSEVLEPHLLTPPYHRGPLMRTVKTTGSDQMLKYMFFLRLRTSSKADPEFGLLRCTIIADSDGEAVQRANQMARLLIEERLPVTFPAPDWDRLIFPIKLCRTYLESLVATREAVKSYFARA